MADSATLDTISRQIADYRVEVLKRLDEINGKVYTHESRLSTVEAKQGLMVKLGLGALGGLVGSGGIGGLTLLVVKMLG